MRSAPKKKHSAHANKCGSTKERASKTAERTKPRSASSTKARPETRSARSTERASKTAERKQQQPGSTEFKDSQRAQEEAQRALK